MNHSYVVYTNLRRERTYKKEGHIIMEVKRTMNIKKNKSTWLSFQKTKDAI